MNNDRVAVSIKRRTTEIRSLFAVAAIVAAVPTFAETITLGNTSGLNLGTAANYALVDLGSGTTLGENSGPVAGSELLGNGVNAGFSGGGNGQITGTLYYDSSVTGTNTFSQLQTPPTTQLVSTSVTQAALASANAVGSYAASLTPTQTYGTISSATTFTSEGGLNVIDVGSINNAALTLTGSASDFFVINISGSLHDTGGQDMVLSGGVTANHILFNFTGTGTVFQTSGGGSCGAGGGGKACLYGTFLATNGGAFQFSNLDILDGALINTAGNVQFVSGSEITGYTPFTPVPVPGAYGLMLCGLGLLGLIARRRAPVETALA